MAQEEQLRIMDKINHFQRDPKAALLIEIERIVDVEKRYYFEELREKVLSDSTMTVSDILIAAEALVDPEK